MSNQGKTTITYGDSFEMSLQELLDGLGLINPDTISPEVLAQIQPKNKELMQERPDDKKSDCGPLKQQHEQHERPKK